MKPRSQCEKVRNRPRAESRIPGIIRKIRTNRRRGAAERGVKWRRVDNNLRGEIIRQFGRAVQGGLRNHQ